MKIIDGDIKDIESEFSFLRQFMVESYRQDRKPFNWRLAMAENWYYASRYLDPMDYFISHSHLWRNENGELVSCLSRDGFLVYPQVSYSFRQIENVMFTWAETHWTDENGEIRTMVYDWDVARQELLTGRGYTNLGAIEDVRIYDLQQKYPPPVLPPGFHFSNMAEYGNAEAFIDLQNHIWDRELSMDWFLGKSSAPSYDPELDLLIVAPGGRLACNSLVWLYPQFGSAEIDPLGTHPDFRRLGLARAIVSESFRKMQEQGMRTGYIASETQDPVVSNLYASFNPVETCQGVLWQKKLHDS